MQLLRTCWSGVCSECQTVAAFFARQLVSSSGTNACPADCILRQHTASGTGGNTPVNAYHCTAAPLQAHIPCTQLPHAQGLRTQRSRSPCCAASTQPHLYAECPSHDSPVLVEQAGRVLLLWLCPVARQELAQEALPCGLALTPQVPEDL